MALNWKREHIEKLIILFQENPCLYNIKSKEYLDRTKKALAMNEILEEMKKTNSLITLEEIKKKWRNIRTQFGKELRLVSLSQKSGAGRSDIHVTKLWCFDQLSFLKTHTIMRTGQENVELQKSQEINLEEDNSISNDLADEVELEEQPKKRFKRAGNINSLRNDLISFKNNLTKRKKEKNLAWLGSLVATQMDEIHPDEQADAAWEVLCLLRKLTSNSAQQEKSCSCSSSSTKDILELSMDGVFNEEDFI